MLYWFFGFLAFLLVFNLFSARYRNPFKLIFLFGAKGSGKSTYMVKLMLKHKRKKWTIYTNMRDVNIPGVRLFDPQALSALVPASNSVLFIDEAGLLWDNRNFKSFSSGLTEFFKLQRKYKCKVYINSQSFDVDKKIRDLTDYMYLMTNIGNLIGVCRPIVRRVHLVEATADSESRIADSLKFAPIWHWRLTLLPRYFRYFDSFEAPARRPVPFDVVQDLSSRSVNRSLKFYGLVKHRSRREEVTEDDNLEESLSDVEE